MLNEREDHTVAMDLDKVAGIEPAVDEAAVEAELARYLAGEPEPEGREPWRITTVGQADWAIEQVAAAHRRRQGYQDEIDLWGAALKRLTAAASWLEERLKEWAAANRTDKVKSFPLAHGTVATRASKRAIDVVDEGAAIGWAKTAAPDAVKVEESFLVSMVGDAARIVEVIVAYESIDKATGGIERVPTPKPAVFDAAKFERLRARLGDGYEVRPVMDWAVLDTADNLVPGLAVRPERVTATVTPLWA